MNKVKVFTLCDPSQQTGCPKVKITKKLVVITDDYGGSVKLLKNSWKVLVSEIKNNKIS